MLPISSREYKVMIDHRLFSDAKNGLQKVQSDLKRISKFLHVEVKEKFDTFEKRTLQFLDSADQSVLSNQLILRHRKEVDAKGNGEFTLKCRIEDRYLAAAKVTDPAKGIVGKLKFEEDIAAPFRSRFSKSQTIKCKSKELPSTLDMAAKLFPALGELQQKNGKPCKPKAKIGAVGGLVHCEQVHNGFSVRLASKTPATFAIILWSKSWEARPQCAELSFRYQSKTENYVTEAVEKAYQIFAAIQTFDWYIPGGTTKTQFAYGEEA